MKLEEYIARKSTGIYFSNIETIQLVIEKLMQDLQDEIDKLNPQGTPIRKISDSQWELPDNTRFGYEILEKVIYFSKSLNGREVKYQLTLGNGGYIVKNIRGEQIMSFDYINGDRRPLEQIVYNLLAE